MRATPKEILNNKSNKMVDLILDEIRNGGSKTIAAGFSDEKHNKNYILTVGITVADIEQKEVLEDVCANCSCNQNCQPSSEEPATEEPADITDPADIPDVTP